MYLSRKHKKSAFTLSELLISLSVLGLISALTLPSVFNAVEKQRKSAVFKETISAVSNSYMSCISDGTCTGANFEEFYKRLNPAKTCPGNTDGCYTNPDPYYEASGYDKAGVILQSGAYMWAFHSLNPDPVEFFYIDYNGLTGPNTEGVDILVMARCWDEEGQGSNCNPAYLSNAKHGAVSVDRDQPLSVALHDSL
jgi:prepilin-type N-terminal cleavage/methylation domain-containing protein